MTNSKKMFLASDIHLTAKSQDEHMWGLFKQIRDQCVRHKCRYVSLLGDLTTAKANHPAEVVNRLVEGIVLLTEVVEKVYIIAGNHDGVSAEYPYWEFLNFLPNVVFIKEPTYIDFDGISTYFLPHTRDPIVDWEGLDFENSIVFAHITVNGVMAENMQKLTSSVEADIFETTKGCFSGDIHRPGQYGNLVYVGAPYHVRYGDQFDGGGIVLDLNTAKYDRVFFDFPKRLVFDCKNIEDILEEMSVNNIDVTGNQVKVRLHLDKDNLATWKEIKREIDEAMVQSGVNHYKFELINTAIREYKPIANDSPAKQTVDFDSYCASQKIEGELKEFGKNILENLVP